MSEKARWKRMIHAYDFAILEVEMYLDTHPRDTKALQLREDYKRKRKQLVDAYTQKFGPYIVTTDDVRGNCWTWVNDPWPWEYVRGE